MDKEKLEKAIELQNEIDKLEEEIDFLLSYSNRYYSLTIEKYRFKMRVSGFDRVMDLSNEDINTICRSKCEKSSKLKKELEEL